MRPAWQQIRAVLWSLRYDMIAVVVVAAAMAWLSTVFSLQGFATVVPLLGVVVSIFIGFRNSNAFNRWWEARTLWGTVVANCRALNNALVAVDDGSAPMAVTLDRMRRRQVRHAWQLAAELRGRPVTDAIRDLTPEDPADATAGSLLTLQAADTRDLVRADMLDRQGRVILTNLNTAQVGAAGGLERVRNEPIPAYYTFFVRSLAWFFGILVCTRVDAGGHHSVQGIAIGVMIMALFVVAERIGHFAEEPLRDSAFALPMDRLCAGITFDVLGTGHPLVTEPSTTPTT
jgi:putative membrane protein